MPGGDSVWGNLGQRNHFASYLALALAGVAVPLAEEMAASRAEKLGVFVRSLGLWKRLMRVRRVPRPGEPC